MIHQNLRNVYERASFEAQEAGTFWYSDAQCQAKSWAKKYKLPLPNVVGIVAALSPGRSWELNQQDAETFMDEWANGARGKGLPLVGSYGWKNIVKAAKCASGIEPLDVLGGDKVRSFYQCILDPRNPNPVCLDRHAKSVAIGRPLKESEVGSAWRTPKQYEQLAQIYRDVAAEYNLIPSQFQAIIWCVWRGKVD